MRTLLATLAALALALALPSPAAQAQESVQLDPEAEEAFFRGVGLLEAGKPRAALAEFDTAVSIQPDFRRAYFYRARAMMELRDWSGARQSAEAYSRFELSDAERRQLAELVDAIDSAAPPILVVGEDAESNTKQAEPEASSEKSPPQAPDPEPTTAAGASADQQARDFIDAGHAQLALGDCSAAIDSAQAALRLSPSQTGAFLLKGLALECQGQLDRARAILLTYLELRGDPEAEPLATLAIERIEAGMATRPAQAPAEAVAPVQKALGADPRIQGVLEDRWGDRPKDERGIRTRDLPGIGKAEVAKGRLELAGSRADGEVARVYSEDGLVFSRLRVWGRRGSDTASWFERAFTELDLTLSTRAGPPTSGRSEAGEEASDFAAQQALSGIVRRELTWTDDDGDTLVLRLGRCSTPNHRNRVIAENQGCLELIGFSGRWKPAPTESKDGLADSARLAETPGKRAWDLGLAIGFGAAPGVVVSPSEGSNTGQSALSAGGGQSMIFGGLGLDVLGRFSTGILVTGLGWSASLASVGSGAQSTPFFDSRITAYVGIRDRPRQAEWRSVLLGIGFLPDQTLAGTPTVAPAISLRIVGQIRATRLGQFFVSFEPYVAAGVGALRIVPLRFSIGGIVGTKARLAGGQEIDPPRW